MSAVFRNGNGGLQALERISFQVCPQEFLCVLGPSGSGKSTLLRILAGLLPGTAGEVIFNGGGRCTGRGAGWASSSRKPT